MNPESTNPYSAPKSSPDVPADSVERTPLPPLTPWRLAGAMALVTIGWIAIWANVIQQISYGGMIMAICLAQIPRMLDPQGLRRKSRLLPIQVFFVIPVLLIGVVWVWFGKELSAPAKEALKHPVTFGFGWAISCGFLLNHWWKRRNNPPYPPKPSEELPSKSPWKPLPRVQDP